MRFYSLNSLNFLAFLQQFDFSLVVYLSDQEIQTELIVDQLTKAVKGKFPKVGFGFVNSDLGNRQLHIQEDICITPLVKFYHCDGSCAPPQWVGLDEILANSGPNEIAKVLRSLAPPQTTGLR